MHKYACLWLNVSRQDYYAQLSRLHNICRNGNHISLHIHLLYTFSHPDKNARQLFIPAGREPVYLFPTCNRSHDTNGLWAHNWNLWKFYFGPRFKTNDSIGSEFCTCHGNQAVMTCAKLCCDWIIILQVKGLIFSHDLGYRLINSWWHGS